jgi:hypothetical protein
MRVQVFPHHMAASHTEISGNHRIQPMYLDFERDILDEKPRFGGGLLTNPRSSIHSLTFVINSALCQRLLQSPSLYRVALCPRNLTEHELSSASTQTGAMEPERLAHDWPKQL